MVFMKKITTVLAILWLNAAICAQGTLDSIKIYKEFIDSLYIEEIEQPRNIKLPDKVLHAEPLFIDLIRDLGARKGEKEWNIGMGFTDMQQYDRYTALVEYEFAPVNRLGLEIEIPVTIYLPRTDYHKDSVPSSRIESLKMAAQYSFLVSEHLKTTLAAGYINELELTDLRDMGKKPFFKGNLFNPFFIAAKRWGARFHTLMYTGPRFLLEFENKDIHFNYELHTSLHYMLPGTRNFIGLEVNKYFHPGSFDMVLRPQMRIGLADNFLAGVVTGIPIDRSQERLSVFMRLIYEPGHRHLPRKLKKMPVKHSF